MADEDPQEIEEMLGPISGDLAPNDMGDLSSGSLCSTGAQIGEQD